MSAQSHLASAGIALHVDPPGVAAARLEKRQREVFMGVKKDLHRQNVSE